jgi:hypothetical protein
MLSKNLWIAIICTAIFAPACVSDPDPADVASTENQLSTEPTEVESAGEASPALTVGGWISRSQVADRAQTWINARIRYNTNATYQGYRTDCSGYVAMALNMWKPGPNTVDLVNSVHQISKGDLRTGDLIGHIGPGTAGPNGHVLIFDRWIDSNHYWAYELHGPTGAVVEHVQRTYPYGSSSGYLPYRYNHISECAGYINDAGRCCDGRCVPGCPC